MISLATLAIFCLLIDLAVSQVSYPSCNVGNLDWSYNSLSQNPCEVAAYLQATCSQGVFSIPALPSGYEYTGPSGSDNSDLCKCNTVTYSLLSACDACQGEEWITWSRWRTNCTNVLPPSTFPNPVPSGTKVPHWALLDVTLENSWNMNKSISAGNSPEIGPGTLIGGSGSSSTGPTGSKTASPPPTGVPSPTANTTTSRPADPASSSSPAVSLSGGSSSHTAAIVGGVVSSIAIIAIVALVIVYLRRKRNTGSPYAPYAASSITAAPSFPPMFDGASQTQSRARKALSEAGTIASSSMPERTTPMGVYIPNNAASLPEVQDPEAPHLSVQALLGPYQGAGNTLAHMHVSRPEEYNRLPSP